MPRASRGYSIRDDCRWGEAFVVQILIGDDVEGLLQLFQPAEDVGVGIELPDIGTDATQMADDLRLHVDDGPEAGGVINAAIVTMKIIKTKPQLGVVVHEKIEFGKLYESTGDQFGFGHVKGQAIVGIGHIACSRQQEGHGLASPPAGRAYAERHVEFVVPRAEASRVEAAVEILRNREGEIHLPAGVVNVVVVKMDCPVMIGTASPIVFLAAPAPPRDAACRQIDQATV
jgi:hypothetical protein